MIVYYRGVVLANIADTVVETQRDVVGLVTSSYSTDFVLSRTAALDALLELNCIINHPQQPYPALFDCEIVLRSGTVAGKLEVKEVTPTEVTLCVYEYDIFTSQRLRDVLGIDATLIHDLNESVEVTLTITNSAVKKYVYNIGHTDYSVRMPNPYVSVNYLLNRITARTGLAITGATAQMLGSPIVPTSFYVDPRRKWQWFYADQLAASNNRLSLGGSHVCTDYEGQGLYQYVRFNRTCTIKAHLYAGRIDSGTGYDAKLLHYRGATLIGTILTVTSPGTDNYVHDAVNVSVKAGDSLFVASNDCNNILLGINYLSYTIHESDYDSVELVNTYPRVPIVGETGSEIIPIIDGETAHFSEYSIGANLGDLTVGNLLDMLSVMFGIDHVVRSGVCKFGSSQAVPIVDGEWVKTQFISKQLGQRLVVDWGGIKRVTFIDNELLSEEVEAYKDNPGYVDMWAVGSLRVMYAPHVEYDDGVLKQAKMERRLAIASDVVTEGGWLDAATPARDVLPFDRCQTIELTTFDTAVRDARYIYFEGNYWLVVECDEDEMYQQFTIKALHVNI